jgi:hypothetical protein
MSEERKNPRSNLQRQLRAIREKRGLGRGTEYRAFIQIRRNDFASHGRSHYWPSAFMNRRHDLLSDLERAALLKLQLLNPLDIREQFPLARRGVEPEFEAHCPEARGTLSIADSLGIRHPRLAGNEPMVMTTDFLVDTRVSQQVAVYVKYAKHLKNTRKQELMAIEREYWSDRGVRFVVFTEEEVNRIEINNLLMLTSFDRARAAGVRGDFLRQVAMEAAAHPMNIALTRLARSTGDPYEHLVDRVKFACSTGRLRLDLSTRQLRWTEEWPPLFVPQFSED